MAVISAPTMAIGQPWESNGVQIRTKETAMAMIQPMMSQFAMTARTPVATLSLR